MCNVPQNIMNMLEVTVRRFLDEGRMFTGYDVTICTRKREEMVMRHQDVREGVHELDVLKDALDFGWDRGNGTEPWTKTQVNMPTGWAWVFHPKSSDPQSYVQHTSANVPSLTSVPKAIASISNTNSNDGVTTDSGGEQKDGTFATDYRNRLLVPTKYLKDAGLSSGDIVYVFSDFVSDSIIICKDSDALQHNGVKITTQTVERNGDIRLSSRTLKAAHTNGNKFVIGASDKMCNGTSIKVVEVKEVAIASTT